MRFAGIGLLIIGALIAASAIAMEDATSALVALVAGGFMFVSGSVFAASSAIQDALKRRG